MYLEKCIIFLKKIELPEGGKLLDFPTFDVNTKYMSEVILIHGVAENSDTGYTFLGPCHIPPTVARLILIPGKTDKHVIVILPRESEGIVLESTRSGSGMNVRTRNPTSLSGMCLNHASKHRVSLSQAISEIHTSKVSLTHYHQIFLTHATKMY